MFDFLEEILHQFRDVPGLSFLRKLHARVQMTQMRYQRRTEHLRGLKSRVQGSAHNAKRLGKKAVSAKRRNEQ